MGGKGSGRPRGSEKELSEVFSGLYSDVVDLGIKIFKRLESAERKMKSARREVDEALDMYVGFNALKSKINYHIRKHEREERKLKRLKKRN
jgi:hypothetical protein